MKIAISSGHGKYIRGASASPRPPYLDEVDEARRVVNRVAELWSANGVGVEFFHDDTSTTQSQNLNTIVNWHNARARDYDVSVHFNAYTKTSNPMGTEVLYVTQQTLAANTSAAIATAANLPNRGAKKRTDLAFLNGTTKPAILLEVCFVDSSTDGERYRATFEQICKRIAEVIGQITIGEPIEPPIEEPPPVEPPTEVAEVPRVEIDIKAVGQVVVSINGQDFMFNEPGPEEPAASVFQPNHQNIICSVFGGAADPNTSAYPPFDRITDQELGCALPWKFGSARPLVAVHNTVTGKDVVCRIRDVGPWVIDDEAYVLGEARPVAEPKGSKIPRGKHQGKTSNGAGLDLTPAAAKAIGLSGMGNVDWRFIEEGEEVA
jgi:N-acetylmuramoyl-L-alanine amidase